ncbi:MAG: bifunctional diaminohydroxyphosphoribosylaminopyrimidine deaminase/5-amino-6-(5-phosphoribosylamino)uracil reductase RibD [Gammaproteobacteria bacterium]|nr:MAG: bifunctional diaminohydroxyphosphoribosylaminopyrimidine deaminase/5-amino-6-(5-phosphoribosylamino)uracil reductase RibD [Gammaproteobacteria bacterium]
MSDPQQDARWMSRALHLAEQGRYSTHPNPRVGCVLVREGQVVGEGAHLRAGGPHAEVVALRAAGDRARGATAYVTLEPCSHHGRTPPCADALIEAGVARVVAAMKDPNPLVAGRGLERLSAAGIETCAGVLEADARALNSGFIKRMETGRPLVRVKVAASLDGRTAMASGESKWITGPAARADVQRLRAQSSAVITGIETVLADDCQLTVRDPELVRSRAEQPLRVVLDSRLRLPEACALLAADGPVWVATTHTAMSARPDTMARLNARPGTRVLTLPETRFGYLDLNALLEALGKAEINEALVEAGATLAGAFVSEGLVDELWWYQAPVLLGHDARPGARLEGLDQLARAPRWRIADSRAIGQDWRFILERLSCSQG